MILRLSPAILRRLLWVTGPVLTLDSLDCRLAFSNIAKNAGMPLDTIIRGDNAFEEYLGLPRGALAQCQLRNQPVPPGIVPPHTKSRFYVVEDVMAWLQTHAESDGLSACETHAVPAVTAQPDVRSAVFPGRRRGRQGPPAKRFARAPIQLS